MTPAEQHQSPALLSSAQLHSPTAQFTRRPSPSSSPANRAATPARQPMFNAVNEGSREHSSSSGASPLPYSTTSRTSAGTAAAWRVPAGHVMPLSSQTLGSVFNPSI